MNIVSVKTWNDRPAMATFTPMLLAPDVDEDSPPPAAWSVRDTISHGMKIQQYSLGGKNEYCGPR